MTIRIGTCSWADKPLVESGRFYPADVRTAEARLRYYASVFPTVEVDSSYYAITSPDTVRLWVDRTPDDFTFHVKAFRLFTGHWADVKVLPADSRDEAAGHANRRGHVYWKDLEAATQRKLWDAFRESVRPLHNAGKLGVLVFQFAPWVPPAGRVLRHIEECKEQLADYQLAIEFRNKAWFQHGFEETMSFLRRHRLVYIGVDEPQGFPSSVPPVVDVTGPLAYLRFHGRNASTWEVKGAKSSADRFDWYYTDEELEEWVPRIEFLERETGQVYALINTNRSDQGPANVRRLAQVLDAAGLGV